MLTSAFNSFGQFHFRHVFERFINIHTLFHHAALDDFTNQDMKNSERIYKNVLKTAKSREQQKPLVKKYPGKSRTKKKDELLFSFFSVLFLATSEKSERCYMESKV